jgi:hypothetical protein
MPARPPKILRDEKRAPHRNKAMVAWMCKQLDLWIEASTLHPWFHEDDDPVVVQLAAEERDIEAFIARYPGRVQRVAPPLPPPPPKPRRGQHDRPHRNTERQLAKVAPKLIRQIWHYHFGRQFETALINEIVARWLNTTEADIENLQR